VAARRRGAAPIVAISGPSGVGKTRLLARLIPALASRGLRVAILKHTGHGHSLDVPGKDTDVLRRAGAVAAIIEGPREMAYFGPPVGGARRLAALLPPVDLVLAEGWKREPLPRIEVHRGAVSRAFLCATDRLVFGVVSDTVPPRAVPWLGADDAEGLADLLCARFGLAARARRPARLPAGRPVRSLPREDRQRADALGRREMPKTTGRKRGGLAGTRSRSAAGRKGGRATLRSRGPEFYSEIGRKGGKSRGLRSRSASSSRAGGRPSSSRRAPGTRAGKARSSARRSR